MRPEFSKTFTRVSLALTLIASALLGASFAEAALRVRPVFHPAAVREEIILETKKITPAIPPRRRAISRPETPKEEKEKISDKHNDPEPNIPTSSAPSRRRTISRPETPKEEIIIRTPDLAANVLLSYQVSQENRLSWGSTFKTVEAVKINPAALELMAGKTGDADLTINIGGRDYKIFQERVDYRGRDNYSWFGKIQGSSVLSHFAVVDDAVAGEIWLPNGAHYSILSRGDGQYLVTWDDQKIRRSLANDVVNDSAPTGAGVGSGAGAGAVAGIDSTRRRPVQRPNWCTGEEIENIDQLIIYTQQAQDWFSKNAVEGEKQIQAAAQNSVDATNGVTINSTGNEWQYRLNLVHTEKVNHTDAGSVGGKLTDDLGWLWASQEVSTLRNTYNADAVMLLVGSCDATSCGSASLPPGGPGAVTATQIGAFGIAHENGHMLWGMGHNPESWSKGMGGLPDWAMDHYVNGVAAGVMRGGGTKCPNLCPTSPHWANPNINYAGTRTPSGVQDERENWRMLAYNSNWTSLLRISGNENRCLTR